MVRNDTKQVITLIGYGDSTEGVTLKHIKRILQGFILSESNEAIGHNLTKCLVRLSGNQLP